GVIAAVRALNLSVVCQLSGVTLWPIMLECHCSRTFKKRAKITVPIWPPRSRTVCIQPENVDMFTTSLTAPVSSASRIIFVTSATNATATPHANTNSSPRKLSPDHDESTCDAIQQAIAMTPNPLAMTIRGGTNTMEIAASHTKTNCGAATQANAWPVWM